MGLEDFKEVVATTATISSSVQLLTGVAVCNAFLKKGTTGDATAITFVSELRLKTLYDGGSKWKYPVP